jgi:hypothetical protein
MLDNNTSKPENFTSHVTCKRVVHPDIVACMPEGRRQALHNWRYKNANITEPQLFLPASSQFRRHGMYIHDAVSPVPSGKRMVPNMWSTHALQ